MALRGSTLVLPLVLLASGCPVPHDEGGDDEIGETSDGETRGDGNGDGDGDGDDDHQFPPAGDDVRAPDDAATEGDDTDDDDTDTDDDDTDDHGEADESETSSEDCWDAEWAGSELPLIIDGSTNSLGDDLHGTCAQFPAKDFVFGFTAPWAATFAFDTSGSAFDTILYLKDGECGLEELACNDDFVQNESRLEVPLLAGQTVTVVVDGFEPNEQGNFQLTISEAEPAVCEAQEIPSVLPQVLLGDTTSSTDDSFSGCGGQGGRDDLYHFVATEPGLHRFHTLGSSFDTVLYLWQQCGGPTFACNDDMMLELQSELVVELDAGEEVWVIVDGLDPTEFGPYQLNVQKV